MPGSSHLRSQRKSLQTSPIGHSCVSLHSSIVQTPNSSSAGGISSPSSTLSQITLGQSRSLVQPPAGGAGSSAKTTGTHPAAGVNQIVAVRNKVRAATSRPACRVPGRRRWEIGRIARCPKFQILRDSEVLVRDKRRFMAHVSISSIKSTHEYFPGPGRTASVPSAERHQARRQPTGAKRIR